MKQKSFLTAPDSQKLTKVLTRLEFFSFSEYVPDTCSGPHFIIKVLNF